jgi:hypothetical protein
MSEPSFPPGAASAATPRTRAWRIAGGAWIVSEAFAFGILWGGGWLITTKLALCTVAGPLAFVTAFARFQYHSLLANALFVLTFLALAALPFLHLWRPRRWTLVVSLIAWALWPWLGVPFTINHL